MKLFLLPYAGGSSLSYAKWRKLFAEPIEPIPLELKGRGARGHLPFYGQLDEVLEDLAEMVHTHVSPSERYCVYGHSMGALLSTELYFYQRSTGQQLPEHLFLSGCKPPHLTSQRRPISHLPEAELKRELAKLGGTPDEVLQSDALMNYFLPIIRADFQLLESYRFQPKTEKMHCALTILNGDEDAISKDEIQEWQHFSHIPIHVHMYKGDHFFIHDHYEHMIDTMSKKIRESYLYV